VDADLYAGMFLAEDGKGGKESVDGGFVDAEREFAALEAFEFGETFFDFVAEVDEALGVVFQEGSGIGEADWAGAANEKRLAERVLELADGEADGGLGAVKTLAGAGEAAFFRHHQKNLKFAEVQEKLLRSV
jgi:hypothetical protein